MSAPCYKCGRPSQPATLNPKALWCTVCAEELNMSGGPLNDAGAAPLAVARGEFADDAAQGMALNQPLIDKVAKAAPGVPQQFRVSVGSVSFTVTGRTELSVGKSKVLIEPL